MSTKQLKSSFDPNTESQDWPALAFGEGIKNLKKGNHIHKGGNAETWIYKKDRNRIRKTFFPDPILSSINAFI